MVNQFRIRTVLIFLSVCALGVVGWYAFLPKEPSFEGKRFSEWIWAMNRSPEGPQKEKARAVVRQLGTNSIPLLLHWLPQEDRPSLTERFDALRHHVFFWLVSHKFIKSRSITALRNFRPSRSDMATLALPELGPAGKATVIPMLIQMLGEKGPQPDELPRAAAVAYLVLSKMAPESIVPLICALTNEDVQVWELAAAALGDIGPDAKAAIPVLEKRLQDRDPDIRLSAAEVLGQLGGDPDQFIPAVIQCLPQVNFDNLDFALGILLLHKEHARAAVPILLDIIDRTSNATNPAKIVVRDQVLSALREIEPETVARKSLQ